MENIRAYYEKGIGGFILTCHLGNWELLTGSGAAKGIPADVVVKRVQNPHFEGLLQWYRRRLGVRLLIETGTAKDILKAISKGRFVGFVLDQFMGPPIGLPVNFMGRLAGTTVSLALLTEKRDIPIVPVYSFRDSDGNLHMVVEPALKWPRLSEDKEQRLFEKTQFLNDVIEKMVRRHPEQWLWLHRRWKDYKGEPRWKPKQVLSYAALLLMLAGFTGGCTSSPTTSTGASPTTGIAIPADPKVNVPKFSGDTEENLDEEAIPKPSEVAKPINKDERDVSKSKKRQGTKKKRGHVDPIVETAPPSKSPETAFDVVPASRVPFSVGEHQEIELSWVGLPAGTATMEVRRGEDFNGRPTLVFWANVLSSRLVDAIYHVDNTAETTVDRAALIPYRFLLHMSESAQKKETKVTFDHTLGKAYYWSQRVSTKWGNDTQNRVDDLVPKAHDMFSGIYYARTLNYQLNQKQSFPVYENGKNWEVELVPVAYEVVTTKVGAFPCWKIQVNVKLNNVLKPTGNVFMWLSDDSKRYLVKFDAKIKIGSLYGNLTSLRDKP